MKNKHFYITIEATAQISGELEKNSEENRRKYWAKIMDYINSAKRKLDYSFYLHNINVMSIYDDKGKEVKSW